MAFTSKQIKQELRDGEFAWPGGYRKLFVMSDGELMHFNCVRENLREVLTAQRESPYEHSGWRVEGVEVYWEGPSMFCCQCNEEIESEYGDPDAEEETPE